MARDGGVEIDVIIKIIVFGSPTGHGHGGWIRSYRSGEYECNISFSATFVKNHLITTKLAIDIVNSL